MSLLSVLKRLEKGDKKRRCLTCKYWYPKTEYTGVCLLSKSPIYKLPNYVCDKWEFWKS